MNSFQQNLINYSEARLRELEAELEERPDRDTKNELVGQLHAYRDVMRILKKNK